MAEIKVPKTMVLDFERMAGLGRALETKINQENPKRLVPVSDATKYVTELIEKHVEEAR